MPKYVAPARESRNSSSEIVSENLESHDSSAGKQLNPKKNKERVVDEDGYVRRVAALCNSEFTGGKILLITSKSSQEKWIVPGGGVNQNETAEDAVLREAFEEAGVICEIVKHLGVTVELDSMKHTDVFLLDVLDYADEWEESKNNNRLRQWFSVYEAKKLLANYRPEHLDYLNLLK